MIKNGDVVFDKGEKRKRRKRRKRKERKRKKNKKNRMGKQLRNKKKRKCLSKNPLFFSCLQKPKENNKEEKK